MNPLDGAGTGDRYGERSRGHPIVRPVIVVDHRIVGQCQCLTEGQKVESSVCDIVSPGRRTIIVVAWTGGHNKLSFYRGNLRQLLRRQRRCDVTVLSVVQLERNERR